jgi:hypothetical protein
MKVVIPHNFSGEGEFHKFKLKVLKFPKRVKKCYHLVMGLTDHNTQGGPTIERKRFVGVKGLCGMCMP